MSVTHTRWGLAAAVAGAGLVLTACGSPTATDGSDAATGEAPSADDPCASSEVVALEEDLAGLDPAERETRLVELAAESGEVTLYGEINIEEAGPLIEAFEEKYEDVSVGLYRAGTEAIRQRVIEEASAGRLGADLIELDSTEMTQIDDQGLLAPVMTPLADEIAEAGTFENFVADRFSYISPSWNTDDLAAADIPQTLQDLADPKYDGLLALESSDVYWFAGLVEYMQEEEGLSEEEAVQVFRDIAANSVITDGHTTTSELVVAGEFALAANTFAHRTISLKQEGAPIEWQPTDIPIVAETTVVGVPCAAPNPAGALLLQDFFLRVEDGQALFAEFNRTPANVEAATAALEGQAIEPIDVDAQGIAREFDDWQELWDEVIRGGATS